MSLARQISEKAGTLWHIQRIKRLVRNQFGSGQILLVTVVEQNCADPACPGPMTQITILGPTLMRQTVTFHKSLAAVQVADIQAIWAA